MQLESGLDVIGVVAVVTAKLDYCDSASGSSAANGLIADAVEFGQPGGREQRVIDRAI